MTLVTSVTCMFNSVIYPEGIANFVAIQAPFFSSNDLCGAAGFVQGHDHHSGLRRVAVCLGLLLSPVLGKRIHIPPTGESGSAVPPQGLGSGLLAWAPTSSGSARLAPTGPRGSVFYLSCGSLSPPAPAVLPSPGFIK